MHRQCICPCNQKQRAQLEKQYLSYDLIQITIVLRYSINHVLEHHWIYYMINELGGTFAWL